MRDELMPGQKLAAYWIEHVLRHNGTKHLQLAAKNIPFYQRHLLDVILFLVAIVFLILLLISATFYFIFRKCFSKGNETKNAKDNTTKAQRKSKGKFKTS